MAVWYILRLMLWPRGLVGLARANKGCRSKGSCLSHFTSPMIITEHSDSDDIIVVTTGFLLPVSLHSHRENGHVSWLIITNPSMLLFSSSL